MDDMRRPPGPVALPADGEPVYDRVWQFVLEAWEDNRPVTRLRMNVRDLGEFQAVGVFPLAAEGEGYISVRWAMGKFVALADRDLERGQVLVDG